LDVPLIHIALVTSDSLASGEADSADHIYFQADRCVNRDEVGRQLRSLQKPVIFSLRSVEEGGRFSGNREERTRLLCAAAQKYQLVELECDRDLIPEILDAVPPEKRIVSWHGPVVNFVFLQRKLAQCRSVAAVYYLLVPSTEKAGDELAAVKLLKKSRSVDLICFASGTIGRWTRILAPFIGSPLVFADPIAIGSQEAPSLMEWTRDYGMPFCRKVEKIYGITGNPVKGSLSPRLHNQAYQLAGLPNLYLPFHINSFADFWQMITGAAWKDAVGMEIGGLTTVSPFKEAAFETIGKTDNPLVRFAGASNLALHKPSGWQADTTDGHGVMSILASFQLPILGKTAAVIGCGGAGRAIAIRLKEHGASVTLFNRSAPRGIKASQMLDIPYLPTAEFNPEAFDLIVHATPQGKSASELPFDPALALKSALIIDLTYSLGLTRLIERAQQLGLATGSGKEVLVYQVRQQYLRMTGQEMPLDLAQSCAGIDTIETTNKEEIYDESSAYQVG
jgi:3-dehydroquinate dehydratase/shikimate dehydrogenase